LKVLNKSPSSKVASSTAAEVSLADLASAAAEATTLLEALANPDRLLLLCSLVEGECNVSSLETLTGIRQPTLSQQLGVLREEGLVETRREGKFIFYRIASAPAMAVLQTLYETFCRPVKTSSPTLHPFTPPEPPP
jgi:DNA-binding transcriptional ArsR family regulator